MPRLKFMVPSLILAALALGVTSQSATGLDGRDPDPDPKIHGFKDILNAERWTSVETKRARIKSHAAAQAKFGRLVDTKALRTAQFPEGNLTWEAGSMVSEVRSSQKTPIANSKAEKKTAGEMEL